jgi:citrate lyase subunit beta / citryl-CoA lyase
MPTRPHRSALYMPGSNARAIDKAKTLPSDAVILDLEDAVAPDAKESARAQVAAAVTAGGFGPRTTVIRINSLDTPWGLDDLDAACKAMPDAILVPKISTPAEVARAGEHLDKRDPDHKMALWLMMETPLGVLNLRDIAAGAKTLASRLACFVLGTNDLAKDLRIAQRPGRASLVPMLSQAVLAARAFGLIVLDGVYNDVKDSAGFAAECRQSADLGFDGKTLVHPSQIALCNEAFAPKPDEIAWAREIITAFSRDENQSKGVIQLNGRMVERLHAEEAKRIVAVAEAIAAAEAAQAS